MAITQATAGTINMTEASAGLWQLISPTLPVGAYSYSQGLESAIEHGWVSDMDSARNWIGGIAEHSLALLDLPALRRCHQAVSAGDAAILAHWNDCLLAARESHELRLEDEQMGAALLRLLRGMQSDAGPQEFSQRLQSLQIEATRPWSYVCTFALAAVYWRVSAADAVAGYLWAWYENQVAAAIKLVPLGQTQGQVLLQQLAADIPALVALAESLPEDGIGSNLPGLGMASSWHEHQYTRLFRS